MSHPLLQQIGRLRRKIRGLLLVHAAGAADGGAAVRTWRWDSPITCSASTTPACGSCATLALLEPRLGALAVRLPGGHGRRRRAQARFAHRAAVSSTTGKVGQCAGVRAGIRSRSAGRFGGLATAGDLANHGRVVRPAVATGRPCAAGLDRRRSPGSHADRGRRVVGLRSARDADRRGPAGQSLQSTRLAATHASGDRAADRTGRSGEPSKWRSSTPRGDACPTTLGC